MCLLVLEKLTKKETMVRKESSMNGRTVGLPSNKQLNFLQHVKTLLKSMERILLFKITVHWYS